MGGMGMVCVWRPWHGRLGDRDGEPCGTTQGAQHQTYSHCGKACLLSPPRFRFWRHHHSLGSISVDFPHSEQKTCCPAQAKIKPKFLNDVCACVCVCMCEKLVSDVQSEVPYSRVMMPCMTMDVSTFFLCRVSREQSWD